MERTAAGTELDPITLEVVLESLTAIVREMRAIIVRTAYSSIIYEGQDFSCALTDARGRLIAKAPADHPIHILPIPWSVRTILRKYEGMIFPGDVFLHNDPYSGGTHLNDVATVSPVFAEGKLFAFVVVRTHWADIGGRTAGSISGQTSEIFEEGVRIPPLRVISQGSVDSGVLDLLLANVRGRRERLGDFEAGLTSIRQAIGKLEGLAKRYGKETVTVSLKHLVDLSAMRMEREIAKLPDGVYQYEAYAESDGHGSDPLVAKVALKVSGEELHADFEGSSPQSLGPVNVGPSVMPSSLFTIAKSYLEPTPEVNQGTWAPLHVHAPKGTFLNAEPPAACGGLAEARYAADSALMGAFALVAPELATGDNKGCANHIYIGGRDLAGEDFIFYEYPAGGTGAFMGGDGNNAMRNFQEGDFTSIQPVESVELSNPLQVETSGIRVDSAGPGRWRGGCGLRRELRVIAKEARLSILSDRNILGPHGVAAGMAGMGNRFSVVRDGIELEISKVPGKVSGFKLLEGDLFVAESSGGGGYGDPLERDPELVLEDVIEGYVTNESAHTIYGVVIENEEVDPEATADLRREIAASRTQAVVRLSGSIQRRGSRRLAKVSPDIFAQLGMDGDEPIEIVNRAGAPLRVWVEVIDGEGSVQLDPAAAEMVRAVDGEKVTLRRLYGDRAKSGRSPKF